MAPSKFRAFMKSPSFLPILCAACLLLSASAYAEKADRNLPINIEADSLRYDDLKQITIFTGNVVMTKGTLIIRGAQIEVRQDPQGYQFGVVTSAPGMQAFFRQKREGVDESIEGEGEVIEFDGRNDLVKLLKNAQLRRYHGRALSDEVSGAEIRYNNTTDVFSVAGSLAAKGVKHGRVRAMLTPRAEPAAGTSGSTETPQPGAKLRSTMTLGGDKP
jgi:lipopolysaccharide export system protein LptA